MAQPVLACLDLEGVLVPEMWITVADQTGIPELRVTTREVPDYDQLMQHRLRILRQHGVRLPDIQAVIEKMRPLEGGAEFLGWLRERCQVVILSDTYYEFIQPLMRQLGFPTVFCHSLEVDGSGSITNYTLRLTDQKQRAVAAFKDLRFRVIAAGDSYNDTSMLAEAHAGIFFRPPDSIVREFPQFPVTRTYGELQEQFTESAGFKPSGGFIASTMS
jgi:phosphoserine / homoserine phosphotransferase